jgi:lipopolysaccharide transport system permease protein
MVQKIYFPRLIIPLAAVGAPLVDYVMGFSVLVALMVHYEVALSWQLLWLPVLVLTMILCALAVGVLLSALTVAYRDFRYVVPFVIQLGLFATPAVYFNVDKLPERFEKYEWLIDLNPMNGPIAAFRAAVLGQPINFATWGVSVAIMLLVLAVGLVYFRQTERRFADII